MQLVRRFLFSRRLREQTVDLICLHVYSSVLQSRHLHRLYSIVFPFPGLRLPK